MESPFRSDSIASPAAKLRQEASLRATPDHATPITPNPSNIRNNTPSHPLTTPSTATTNSEYLAQSARKEWKLHGSGMTQTLEEKRVQRPGTISVRVISAVTRRDLNNAKFTSYVLETKLSNAQVLQIEHRYSEFAKLHDLFKTHNIILDASFPSKHWAGRMGQWTPSLKFAPEKHEDLIQFRKIQLDVWLVHIVEKYNLGDLPHSLSKAIYDFLTTPNKPPCEQELNLRLNQDKANWKLQWNNPLSFTLGSSIRQATSTLEYMCHHDDLQSIPLDLLKCSKGLCFLTVIKAGLVVSGRVGTGLLVAQLENQSNEKYWSAPCAMGTMGMGWGMLAGGDITHYLVVLTTTDAVDSLLSGTVQLGAEMDVAVGPMGRGATSQVSASNNNWAVHPAYSYAHSQGLFAGVSLEGSILKARDDVNVKFYGIQNLVAEQVLDLPPPKAAEPLYSALHLAMETEIADGSFRPSQVSAVADYL